MIREYLDGDLDVMDYNKWVHEHIREESFKKLINSCEAFTLFDPDTGENIAVIAYKPYTDRCYVTFTVCSKRFNAKFAKEFKRFVVRGRDILQALRYETISKARPEINRFHEFLDFKLEGTKRKYFDGEDYNIWGWVR
jgi:hypothetical protein